MPLSCDCLLPPPKQKSFHTYNVFPKLHACSTFPQICSNSTLSTPVTPSALHTRNTSSYSTPAVPPPSSRFIWHGLWRSSGSPFQLELTPGYTWRVRLCGNYMRYWGSLSPHLRRPLSLLHTCSSCPTILYIGITLLPDTSRQHLNLAPHTLRVRHINSPTRKKVAHLNSITLKKITLIQPHLKSTSP